MKILISGASGLIGTNLIPTLIAKGHEVHRLVRKKPNGADEIRWDAEKGFTIGEKPKLENFEAVIHLAGDNVASENWSDAKKKKIRDSRVLGTKVLVDALKDLKNPPQRFIAASAIGFYGSRGDEVLTEESQQGKGFLPEVCADWEAESQRAEAFAKVVCLRIGVVLAKEGGALEKMLTPFNFGVGGKVGSGKQWMSWIALDDVVRIFHFALENENLNGAINTVAPVPVTNEEFTKTLGKVLNRPTFMSVPEFAIKLLFGEMGKDLLLEGAKVIPKKLQNAGFKFDFPNFEESLKHVLQKTAQ